ncbi:MAG: carboxylesterase/lipase family protein [Bradymonadia bacterium]
MFFVGCDDGTSATETSSDAEVEQPDAAASTDPGTGGGGGQGGAGGEPVGGMPEGGAGGVVAPGDCPIDDIEAPGLVATTEGHLQGEASGDTWLYRAVPFAAPPVDDLRWRAPEPPACYGGIRVQADYAPACPQLNAQGTMLGDEDCLYLNLWTPKAALEGGRPRPIMFFIHGGGNAIGSATVGAGNQILYDGQALAEAHDAVVVVIQYRLGALGYLTHPALDAEDPEGHSGNYGQLDIIAALEWINANAAAFGGDRDRVMIFGESAGARNTCIMVSSPLARGLFYASIMQSGPCRVTPRADVEAEGRTQVENSGCADAEDIPSCMRARTAEQLLLDRPPVVSVGAASDAMKPYVDGHVLTDQPIEVIRRGEHNPVIFVSGANSDETARDTPEIATVAGYEAVVRSQFGALADQVLALYPAEDYETPTQAFVQISTDARFVCNSRQSLEAASAHGPTFGYFFTQNLENSARLRDFGAYHAIELFFVFDQMTLAGYRPTAAESALAEMVGGYWARVARQGDPNDGVAPMWPQYDITEQLLVLDGAGVTAEAGIRSEKCDFWDTLLEQ